MMPRVLATPIAADTRRPRAGVPHRVSADVLDAVLPGPGRDRLAKGEVLVVTTGQQPGLFTGPLYTVHKALSAIALAARLERERHVPVVPVFWAAGDDADFAEANHCAFLDAAGDAHAIVLRERTADAPQRSLFREPCGEEVIRALEELRTRTPDTEFKAPVLSWLAAAYRPEQNLADAFAEAVNALLASHGLAVFRAHAPSAKRAAAPWLLKALDVVLPDGLSPVLVEGKLGRDRLRAEEKTYVTRRSEERFTRADLEEIATTAPERLSPNVLLRPAVEAALFPTVAYCAGPGELQYLPDAAPCHAALGVTPQTPVPRWSGVLIESKVEKVLDRHRITAIDLKPPAGALEGRIAKGALPPETLELLERLRTSLTSEYDALAKAAATIDPTLERTVQSARNQALGGTHEIEKKLVASVKRTHETLTGQITKARAALYPLGTPQERSLTVASFLLRYGSPLVDELAREVARWTDAL
ncbi:MAG TPA: bacillithiol biosynthesis BshC [Gemmatimonadales bacterium]|nr:bacillithiol biosynthesis BshC [Gemmatimonadales bacterium]